MNYVDRVAPYGTTPPPEPVAGAISVISQSGTVAWTMNQLASDRGVGLRIILGVGNEAVLGLGDLFEWAAADPHDEGRLHVHRDHARRGRDRPRSGRAARRAQADPGLRARGAQRGGTPFDRGAHRGAGRQHRAPRRVAPRARRDPGRGPGDDVRGLGAARLTCNKLRTPGVAAALQSGGACTLFAEAAGAQGLVLPEFSPLDQAAGCRKALPHFASQNNPLDVTGQAAVETDMFCAALDALARDPAVGLDRVRRVPTSAGGRDALGGAGAEKVRALRKETGVVFASRRDEPARIHPDREGIRRKRAPAVPAGTSRGRGRDPGATGPAGRSIRGRSRTCPRTRTAPRRCGCSGV